MNAELEELFHRHLDGLLSEAEEKELRSEEHTSELQSH